MLQQRRCARLEFTDFVENSVFDPIVFDLQWLGRRAVTSTLNHQTEREGIVDIFRYFMAS